MAHSRNMSVIVFGCVLVSAYTSLCRFLEYLLKVWYIIQSPTMFFVTGWKHCPMSAFGIYLQQTFKECMSNLPLDFIMFFSGGIEG